jgi:hypothetical protein
MRALQEMMSHGLDHEMVMMVHRQAMGCGHGKENEGL